MSIELKQIRIFISSPGDVIEERALTRKVIERLQGEYSGMVSLEPIYWEHEPLRATASFPEEITRPSETDIVITILWSRLGTRLPAKFKKPDGSRYESGTEYEFEDAYLSFKERGTPDLLIYRKTADPKVSLKDKDVLLDKLKQKEALDSFFDRWFHDRKEGTLVAAFHPFDNSADFEDIFESHLSKLIKMRSPDSVFSDKTTAIKPVWKEGSPFRGLSVFNFEHAPVFFGRTKAASEIMDALRIQAAVDKAFILVLGMSGGGKSSLVRAGVLPMLTQPGVIEGVGLWRRAIMKPGDSPGDLFDGLASCLLQQNALPELSADGTGIKELAKILRETPKAAVPLIKGGLSQAAAEITKSEKLKNQPVAKLVLVVDQMEEMFSLERITHKERTRFIEAIDALSRSGRVWVIATLRSDFYPRTAELEGLIVLKEGSGQYDLLSPTPAEIGQMIRQPAQAAGLFFEEDSSTNERLEDVLKDAAAKNPGALPLLEFTLEELYNQQTENGMLTFDAYNKLGGVEGALAQRAEEVFAGLDPKVQQAMDIELHSLISIGVDDGERISRKYAPVELVTATPETKAFVDAFVDARLFTTDLSTNGNAVVNIAHEALLQHWPRLQNWIEKNREDLRVHARVNVASRRWKKENKSREFLWSAAKQVNEAEELIKNKKIELTQSEKAFVRASIAKRKRVWWIKRGIAAALVVLTLFASGAAYLAQQERDKAKTEAKTAEQVSEFLVGLFEVSDPSEALGDTITAREILDKGAEKIEIELIDQPEVQGRLMNTMGKVYRELGLYDQAISLLEKALYIRKHLFGDMHPDVASSMTGLGRVYYSKGNYSKAEDLYREALAIRQKIYGNKHPLVAQNINQIGLIKYENGNYTDAKNLFQESLKIVRNAYGNEHLDVANYLFTLGSVLDRLNEDEEAEILYLEAIAIYRNFYGNNHPDIASCLSNIGGLYIDKGDYYKAEKLCREVLKISQKIYGYEHPRVATHLCNLGYTLKKVGNYSLAEEYYNNALTIRRNVFGNLHTDVANSLNNLGALNLKIGKDSLAREMIQEALDIRRELFGNNHPDVAYCLCSLAAVFVYNGNYSKAEEFYKEAYEIFRKIYGDEHPDVALSLRDLAGICYAKGNYSRSEELYREALEIQQKILPEGNWQTAETMRDLGDCLAKLKRYQEAETFLLESFSLLKEKRGADDKYTINALNRIIELYEAWDKPENVAEYEALLADTATESEPI